MKKESSKDSRNVIYEPLLFGSIAIIGGIIYVLVQAIF